MGGERRIKKEEMGIDSSVIYLSLDEVYVDSSLDDEEIKVKSENTIEF